jgi:1-deoxy-D-xylulose-5-phosphate synthase
VEEPLRGSYPLLEKINSPRDLRALPEESLPQLCAELRAYLLEVVSGVGGHLSSSLGVVELTVALHYVLNTPADCLVWDVGHQAYIHKILTGRREALTTIRQYGGISGFLKRSESDYDVYGAGHASTALSAAYGMAVARDLKGLGHRVAAVFGDGALTGGLCYEALNNAGASRRPFLAVLNDNQMSISPNVGAIHRYLNDFVQTRLYQAFRHRVREGLQRIPKVGKPMTFLARRIEEGAKGILTPGALFEALGFDYYGPVDGHDVKGLVKTLKNLRDLDHPVLLHVLTVKGKGYARAEESPEGYHGVKPFAPEEGIIAAAPGSGKPAFQDAFGSCLTQLAAEDPRVVGITAAMPTGTGLTVFAERHPERFFDVGIAEEHAVLFAAGLAAQGMRPVAAIYSTFLQRAYDQLVHDVALQHLPVVFCLDRAGIAGEDGPTHHGAFDLAYLRHIPGMVVAAPRHGNELRDLLATAIAHESGPFAIRYPKAVALPFTPGAPPLPLPVGRWEVAREGSDAAVLAVGPLVEDALQAAEELALRGISVEVVNCRFVSPLDEEYLAARLPALSFAVTVEEGILKGGFGSGVLEWKESQGVGTPVARMGIPDQYVPHGARGLLLRDLGLTAEGITKVVAREFGRLGRQRRAGTAAAR